MPQAGQEATNTYKPITECPKKGLKQVIDAFVQMLGV